MTYTIKKEYQKNSTRRLVQRQLGEEIGVNAPAIFVLQRADAIRSGRSNDEAGVIFLLQTEDDFRIVVSVFSKQISLENFVKPVSALLKMP